MKKYKVIVTDVAKEQLADYISYILKKFKNKQAARALRDDAKETKNELSAVAGSIAPLQNEKFAGYCKIHFRRHRYIMIFHIEEDTVYVDRIYHELQDYENKFE